MLDRVLLVGVLSGVLLQIYAAGLMWYGTPTLHRAVGWPVLAAALVHVPISLGSRDRGSSLRMTSLVAGLLMLQPVFVFGLVQLSTKLAALHALNAALVLLAASWNARRGFRPPRA